MKRKHFILAFVAMLWSFSFKTFAETVVVNSFEELKAEVAKRKVEARANAMRNVRATTSSEIGFGTVQLGNDIVLSETLEVGNTYELTLDLNGHTISPAQGTSNYFINLGSTTIHDDSEAQTGTINCAIQNGNDEVDYAYLEIQRGTVKSLDATGAAVTNYAECVISGGKFFSEHTGLTNYKSMEVDGSANFDVYIEGKTYSIKNSGELDVKNAVIAGTDKSYKDENGSENFTNVTYFNVALNGRGYTSLQAAVDAATDGDLIRLFGDITETATVSINKAITLDGNGKSLKNAIKVSETTGNVSITDLTVATDSEYALQVEISATEKVIVSNSKLSGTGAVKADAGTVVIENTDLSGSNADVISVASDVVVNLSGGSIKAFNANNAFIIGGTEGCTNAQLSIMTTKIVLGGVKNYINLDTDDNIVKLHNTFKDDLYNKGYVTDAKGIALTVYNAVANVNGKNYRTLAEALDAAQDSETVTLLWADYKAPVSMAGTVAGDKTVTITGTAQVDWSKGWFYVGRNATGNGKVIFDNANLTSVSNSRGIGINVSGSKKDSDTTNDGAVEIKNSTIVLDYLLNKGAMSLDNATLTVKNGFATGGRPAGETESGEDATATMTLSNGSKLVVNNHNGMGLGYEAIGVMNIDATSTFETTQSFLVTAKGTMNVNGGTVKIVGTLTNNGTVYATGAANLEAKVTGAGWFYMNGVSLDADTKLDGAKVAFINGTNSVVGSTIKNGWFNVGVGNNNDADAAAAFAQANGIALGDVTVNVSDNAVISGNGDTYSGWVGSAYSADKNTNKYALNINNSLATFGYMHVSKDGALSVDGRSADDNKYTYDNANVNFYAGDFIINGVVTLNNADAWARTAKISVDHVGGVLNINGDTKFEASRHNGATTGDAFVYYKAGEVNVAETATVEIDNVTTFVDGAVLNIAGNVTAKGSVTGAGTITLTDVAAVYTAPADLTVGTNIANKMVVYHEGAYKVYNPAAKIGEVFYLTLQEAIDAAVDGTVITFVNDVTEDVTVVQAPDVKITIDGADKNMYGIITVNGKSAAYATAGLTIQNVKFLADGITKDASINLGGTNATRYTSNVTVDNCTFTGTTKEKVGVKNYTGGCKNVTITNCTATGMHSLAQLKTSAGVTLTNNKVTEGKNGISVGSSTNVVVDNCNVEVSGYGVRAEGASNVVVTDSKIEAFIPVVVRKATAETFLTFNGDNTITASNTEGLWCAIGIEEYGDVLDDGTEITKDNLGVATGKVRVTLNDASLDEEGVYGNFVPVAMIGTEDYDKLQKAIDAVKNGEEIVLVADCDEAVTFTQTRDVSFVLNGNGKTMTGSINITARAGKDAPSTLVIKDFNFKTTETTYDFIKSTETNYYPNNITIEGCTFEGPVGNDGVVAVRLKSANNITIKNCTGTGLHSFLQNTAGWNLTIDNVDVDDAAEGAFALGTVQGVTVKNCDINSSRYGIRLDAQYNNNAVIADNKINAFIPVVVRKASVDGNITFEGNNEFAQTNTDGYWCVIGTDEYKTNGALPTAVTAKIEVTLNDSGLDLDGIYGNFGVASIGKANYLTFAEALEAVQGGETIVLTGAVGAEKKENGKFVEIEFTKDIEFTITGNAPEYALPVVTFQNAEVTIKDAKILIPELDARENATINVDNSTVYSSAGGDPIVKSYFNGAINITNNSKVYTHQATTMGYINVDGTSLLNVTWQTNVFGNGMITLAPGATLNTAALQLTAKDYSGRDNTDSERVGKPATIVVDGATLTAGKVYSASDKDYSYETENYGINVGTIEGKNALLDIKNGGTVNFYMADGYTVNFGAGATVSVNASTLTTACRAEGGKVTLANAGTVNVTGASTLNIPTLTGNAINITDATLADVQVGGAVNAFGTNNISGTSAISGQFSVGYNKSTEPVVVNITGNFTGGNVLVGYTYAHVLNVGDADGERTTAHFATQLGAFGDVSIANADVTYQYAFIRNDFNVINSALAIKDGINTYIAGNAKVVVDNSTWSLGAYARIGEYSDMWGNADVTLKNSSSMMATNLHIMLQEGKEVKVAIDETSSLTATNLTNQGVMNIAGTVTASTKLANTGTINFTSLAARLVTPTEGVVINHEFEENYKIVYKDGAYSFGDFVAEIDGVYYDDIETALKALTEGATLKFLNDVTVTEAWDCRNTGGLIAVPNVTIDGNGKTFKLTGDVSDPNTFAVFRVPASNATFKNLTIDVSEAEKVQRAITASLSITVDNCKFIGNGTTSKYGVIFGEGAQSAIGSVEATVTGSEFVNFSYGVSDNRNGQDAKSVTVTGNKFVNSKVLLSASESVTFNGNTVNGASVSITSYSNATNVCVTANDNTLDAAQANQITTNPANLTTNGDFAKAVATSNNVYYLTLPEAIEKVAADAEITMLSSVTGAGAVINKNVTINFNGNTYTFNKGVGSTGTESNGFQILKDNTVTLKNGTLNVAEEAKATFYTVIQNYANLTIEGMNLDGTNLDKWSTTDGDSYVLSINSGNVVIKGNTNITANDEGDNAFAFDACDKTANGYTLPVVTVETSGTIKGLIESTATIVIKDGTYTMDVTKWCAEEVTAEPVEVDGKLVYTIVRGITIIDGQLTEFTNDQNKENCYIRYERTLPAAGNWYPLYVPFEIPVEKLTALGYEAAFFYDVHFEVLVGGEINPTSAPDVHLIKIKEGTLKANFPYVIRANANADLNLTLAFKNTTLYSTAASEMNSVESGSTINRFIFAGTYKKAIPEELTGDADVPCYAITNNGTFKKMNATASLAPFRVYMSIIAKNGSPVILDDVAAESIRMRVIGEENEDGTTFIYDVEMDGEQTADYIYDLQGRRVLDPQKGGLYIVNGKKVVF